MKKELLHAKFLEVLKERVPIKPDLVNLLIDLLCIEKEAVYRRLRGEVAFTFSEIAVVANELGISLDNTINNVLSVKSKPYQLKMNDFAEPSEMDYTMMEQYVNILKEIKNDPDSTIVDSTNILPASLYFPYKYISRFYLFKWLYQLGDSDSIKSYAQLDYPLRVQKLQKENETYLKHIKNTYYILDPLVFQYMVNDIKYFLSINLMTEEDKAFLKKDFETLLHDMEILAIRGYFEDTKNKVRIYISCVNFDVSCWYIDAKNYHINMIKVFVLSNIASLDETSFLNLKKRIDALLRSSTLISVSGERQRIDFFEEQRKIISTL